VFDDLSRGLRRLSQTSIEVSRPVPSDADGYVDKECPSAECLTAFKVHGEDWTNLARDEVVYCPICRYEADSRQWFTTEQVEYIQRVGLEELKGQLDEVFKRGTRAANRRAPKGGLITFSLSYKPGRREYIAPLEAGEILEQRSTCEVCGCRYASIGAAFFCPACGHNSAISTFAATIASVRDGLAILPKLRESLGKDAAVDIGRGIIENGVVKLVTAFQRVAEATYASLPEPKETPGLNAFQRLAEGSRLWRAATGRGFDDILDPGELIELGRYFQQRNSLVHDDGIVDQLYLDRSGDATYKIGQRLVVKPAAVRRAADLIEKLATGL
jgi:hypothetical protein